MSSINILLRDQRKQKKDFDHAVEKYSKKFNSNFPSQKRHSRYFGLSQTNPFSRKNKPSWKKKGLKEENKGSNSRELRPNCSPPHYDHHRSKNKKSIEFKGMDELKIVKEKKERLQRFSGFGKGQTHKGNNEIENDAVRDKEINKVSKDELQRNKRMFNFLRKHVKDAKKEIEKELNSKNSERLEVEKRVNESISKSRSEFNADFKQKSRLKALNELKAKKFKIVLTEWKIKRMAADNLISKQTELSKTKSNFILTKTTPALFFKPATEDEKIKQKIRESLALQEDKLKEEIAFINSKVPPEPDEKEFLENYEDKMEISK